MLKFNFDKRDLIFLKEKVSTHSSYFDKIVEAMNVKNDLSIKKPIKYDLELDENEVESMIDEFTEMLTTKGMDSNAKLNSFGNHIEIIIDILSEGFYK